MVDQEEGNKQLSLLEADIYDAFRSLVDKIGAKKIGPIFFPKAKDPEDAAKRLLNCLDRERRDKLDLLQIVRLLRYGQSIGYHDTKHFFDRVTGYHESQPKTIAEEKEDILRKIHDKQVELQNDINRLGELVELQSGKI